MNKNLSIDMRQIINRIDAVLLESRSGQNPIWFEEGKAVADPSKVNDDCNDFLEPEEWDWLWKICIVPIDIIVIPTPDFHDEERMNRLRKQSNHSPIILQLDGSGIVRLIDGYHRIKTARERGMNHIKSLVGRS